MTAEETKTRIEELVRAYSETESIQYAAIEPRLKALDREVAALYPWMSYNDVVPLKKAASKAWAQHRRSQAREERMAEELQKKQRERAALAAAPR